MGNFKQNLDLFLSDTIQDSIEKLRNIDEDYNAARKKHFKESEKVEKIINDLSDKDKEFLEKFTDDLYMLEARAQDWLYLQGYKDCIKLLKLVEAI